MESHRTVADSLKNVRSLTAPVRFFSYPASTPFLILHILAPGEPIKTRESRPIAAFTVTQRTLVIRTEKSLKFTQYGRPKCQYVQYHLRGAGLSEILNFFCADTIFFVTILTFFPQVLLIRHVVPPCVGQCSQQRARISLKLKRRAAGEVLGSCSRSDACPMLVLCPQKSATPI